MTQVLIVTSSAQSDQSVSSRLADHFEAQLRAADPGVRIVRRDVGAQPLPHLTAANVAAIRGTPQTQEELATRRLSDELIGELGAADLIVIASPMYNFGISSTLKAWFDHVLRAGVTFRYTEQGPEGLLKGRKVVVIESRAGLYSEGEASVMDGQEPHLRAMLGFMGLEDISWVRAERLAFGAETAEASIGGAADELDRLAELRVPLAA